jgi:hypothetical protein
MRAKVVVVWGADSWWGCSGLRLAVEARDLDMLRLLLQLGARWSDVDVLGDSPLTALPLPLLRQIGTFYAK